MSPRIKFFLILGIVILVMAIVGYFKAIPGAKNQENLPKIEIMPKSFDFGDIEYGEIVSHTFKIKNLGDAVLEIKRVATSCACTTAKINKEKINPNEETELLVTYDSDAMGELHGKGRQERIIYIKNSDPVNPQVEVVVYANVK